ncbi:MAG: MFS transporter [Oscillospiraceae bacterium]|nr:MFS transporter [Oscillospiraceae bacterium]
MKKNKYLNGILPMILMNLSIGAVYCWTLFKEDVLNYTNFDKSVVEWCFSLAIFFLGMSAAFGGKIVEKDVKKSSLITFFTFTLGWIVTGFGIQFRNPVVTILGFGVIQGIGLGLGYITPVKTLMVWMDKSIGFAAGLSITGFAMTGLILNPLIAVLLRWLPVYGAFYLLAGIFGTSIFISYLLIYRPEAVDTRPEFQETLSVRKIILTKKFIFLWLVFFLNIACGLALISQEKQIYRILRIDSGFMIVLLCDISVFFNLSGRLSMATLQDRLRQKHIPYYFMAALSLLICILSAFYSGLLAVTLAMMWVVNFFFGCGFSCLPNILHQHYGINQLATIQGLSLSAWAVAGLAGNQFSYYVITHFSLGTLYTCLGAFYAVELVILLIWVKTAFDKQKRVLPAGQ